MTTRNNDEIQKIIVSVFELTGYKVSADDPIVAMMLIQRREMAELVSQHKTQQQSFLDKLTEQANAIVGSADEFKGQKQIVIQEILKANAEEMAQAEAKLFAQTSKRIQEQFSELSADLFHKLETRTFRMMMVLLVIQVGVLLASLVL